MNLLLLFLTVSITQGASIPSVTTVRGSSAPKGPVNPGQLIFEDNCNALNLSTWTHEGNNNVVYFNVDDRRISFADDGKPYILPTPKSIAQMTKHTHQRPTESARITTKHSFSFTNVRMEVRAKVSGVYWNFPGNGELLERKGSVATHLERCECGRYK